MRRTRARKHSIVSPAGVATPIQIAIAWLLARSPMMIPIPGTSSVAHLEENMAAARFELTPQELRELT
jgi:aryl-alcohol dehydrogenase-like predicted oxidoreductase